MSTPDLLVLAGAATLIAWVNWYFFFAGRSTAVAATSDGATPGQVVVMVDGGYAPNAVQARVGVPLKIIFDRRDNSSCSEEVVMPEFGVKRYLPTGERTTVEITPTKIGRFDFTCGMGMLHGTVVVDA